MATEADTSGTDAYYNGRSAGHGGHFGFQAANGIHHHLISSSSGGGFRADSARSFHAMEEARLMMMSRDCDDDSDDNDKLISVDEFDDSDSEDIRRSSALSPTLSDSTVNSSSSHQYGGSGGRHGGGGGGNDGRGKLRKKSGLATKAMDEQELQKLRLKINSRERKRMHDLNSALDGLREVMPYAHGPSVRKLSKIATLLLAKNYILMLNSSLEEMKKLVSDIYHHHGQPRTTVAPPLPPTPPQQPPTSTVNGSTVTSSNGGTATTITPASDTVGSGVTSRAGSPKCKSPDSQPAPIHSVHQPSHHLTQLHSHPSPLPSQPVLPIPIPALRAAMPALSPHEFSALSSAYSLQKSELSHQPLHAIQAFPPHERLHPYQRWPTVPCACAQCLTGTGHLALGLHRLSLPILSHPGLTSTASIQRKS